MRQQDLDALLLQVQKPARYIGGETDAVIKNKEEVLMRYVFCFPDTYEIGMSFLGMKILYGLMNAREDTWCERAFAPDVDFEQVMRREGIPLYALESLDPISDFDIIGFTLQYEMSYTNVLHMLTLGNVPLLASQRKGLNQLVVAGGPCCCNAEPMCDFIDAFFLGESEEQLPAFLDLYGQAKREGWSKEAFLREAAIRIEGIYVPSLYTVTYHPDGRVAAIEAEPGIPKRVQRAVIRDLDRVYYPDHVVVPFVEVVHDRAVTEVMRGCMRGCRFCQAGFIYRPLREKEPGTVAKNLRDLCESTGYEEVSLSSLSTSDYSGLPKLLDEIIDYTDQNHINLSLPSLRIDKFSKELLDKTTSVRKSGLTFAPEAGTQRLRDVINKNVTREDVLKSCRIAFEGGYTSVKLYFMLGLPTETDEDIVGIINLAKEVIDTYYQMEQRPKGGVQVTVSVSTFVPKPHTPFQYEPQIPLEEIRRRQQVLVDHVNSKKMTVKYHDAKTTVFEGVLARGDRRLGKVLLEAYNRGCYFDSWDEHFKPDRWLEAFAACGLDPAFYANRQRDFDEILPWSHLDYGISESFLQRENRKAHAAQTTPNCREACSGCGASKLMGGKCFDNVSDHL